MRYCVGVDIGGTTVKCGIFTVDGMLVEKWEIPTRKENNGENILPDTAESVRAHLTAQGIGLADLEGVGMGVPGPVQSNGYVHTCVNLGWKAQWPAEQMKKLMGGDICCMAGNDANVAALGEMWQGAGKQYRDLMMVTLGTGVGGGLIIDGKIINGSHGAGAEIGHMHVRDDETEQCTCGGYGCLEQAASATGIVRLAKRAVKMKGSAAGPLTEYGDRLEARHVCELAISGDATAAESLKQSMDYLGEALARVSMISDPAAFVLGGGVSKAGNVLIDMIKTKYNEQTALLPKKAEFLIAELGNDAGIYGSAYLVLSK